LLIISTADRKSSKGSGPDGIPPRILKSCSDGFKRPLTLLFNKSLSEGVFPESWKRSYVVPIFKGGKRNLIENYRGIAILSAMPKLFELLVFDSLFFHLKSSIAAVQHGFFKGRSAVSNLMEFASLCIRRMEEGIQTDAVYTDFSKAFDRINHLILLAKLRSYGIVSKLNSWFSSYLKGRTQTVRICKHESEVIYVKSGVPQGSHLGPLLFFCL
jgi:hypothetical protein